MWDRDDMMWTRLVGLQFGSTIDWVAVFAFFAIALIYFLAPVIGYSSDRRGTLAASLFLLLGYAGISVLQYGIFYLQLLDRGGDRRPDDVVMLAIFGFAILKLLAFFLALLLFVLGLLSMRIRRADPPDLRRDDWHDEPRYDR